MLNLFTKQKLRVPFRFVYQTLLTLMYSCTFLLRVFYLYGEIITVSYDNVQNFFLHTTEIFVYIIFKPPSCVNQVVKFPSLSSPQLFDVLLFSKTRHRKWSPTRSIYLRHSKFLQVEWCVFWHALTSHLNLTSFNFSFFQEYIHVFLGENWQSHQHYLVCEKMCARGGRIQILLRDYEQQISSDISTGSTRVYKLVVAMHSPSPQQRFCWK